MKLVIMIAHSHGAEFVSVTKRDFKLGGPHIGNIIRTLAGLIFLQQFLAGRPEVESSEIQTVIKQETYLASSNSSSPFSNNFSLL